MYPKLSNVWNSANIGYYYLLGGMKCSISIKTLFTVYRRSHTGIMNVILRYNHFLRRILI